nr:zinc finger, CCHC-type [Tanacetum cinerariifolium]
MCMCSETVTGNAVTTAMAITENIQQGLLDKAKGNVLGMEIVRDQSHNTLRVSQSKFYNGKLVQTLLEGHFILSLEGSLSGDCDEEKNDIRTGFCGLITVMGRSITSGVHDTYEDCKRGYLSKGTHNKVRIRAKDSSGNCYTCLVKGGPRIEVTTRVEAAAYRRFLI